MSLIFYNWTARHDYKRQLPALLLTSDKCFFGHIRSFLAQLLDPLNKWCKSVTANGSDFVTQVMPKVSCLAETGILWSSIVTIIAYYRKTTVAITDYSF